MSLPTYGLAAGGQVSLTYCRMTLFLVMFLAGWNDASQGPLLPSLQSYYDVNYTISKSTSEVQVPRELADDVQSRRYGSPTLVDS